MKGEGMVREEEEEEGGRGQPGVNIMERTKLIHTDKLAHTYCISKRIHIFHVLMEDLCQGPRGMRENKIFSLTSNKHT